ncbi:MAG: winged helix DNA-binding domain-containing protein [Thermoanaerobaculia bacterium]
MSENRQVTESRQRHYHQADMLTGSGIPARRLIAQQIARPALKAPRNLVASLGAVQAQDYAAAKWAIGLRLHGNATDADIERAIDDGAMIRTHALRGTWQLIAPEDVRWMLDLVAPRLIASYATRYRQLEFDAAMFRRGNAVLTKALGGGAQLTRAELASAYEAAGISTTGQRLAHLLQHAELEALICGGVRRGKQFTYTLLENRAPSSLPHLERDEALAELALRYFRSRGPATLDDFKWWSGLAPAEARAGLEAVQSKLTSTVIDSRTYWHDQDTAPRARSSAAFLLPAFDEYLIAYRDRDAVLDPKYVKRLNAGGGMLGSCIVLDGRVIGTWRRTLARATVAIELDLFEAPTRREHQALATAAQRYGAFHGVEASVVTPF